MRPLGLDGLLLHGHLNGLEDAVLCIGPDSGLALLLTGDLAVLVDLGNLRVGGLKLHGAVCLDIWSVAYRRPAIAAKEFSVLSETFLCQQSVFYVLVVACFTAAFSLHLKMRNVLPFFCLTLP